MLTLENFYSVNGIYEDKDHDGLPDGIRGKIYLQKNALDTEKRLALNLLARLAYDCTAMSVDNLVFYEDEIKNPEGILIQVDPEADINWDETRIFTRENQLVILAKTQEALEVNGQYLYGRMPYIWEVEKEAPTFSTLKELLPKLKIKNGAIEEIVLSQKYKGLKELKISAELDSVEEAEQIFKKSCLGQNIQRLIFTRLDQEEVIIENKDFIEEPHASLQDAQDTGAHIKRKDLDLADIFSIKGIYSDSESDLMNNQMDFHLVAKDNLSDETTKALGNMVTRAALDCLQLKLDLVKKKSENQSHFIEIVPSGQGAHMSYDNQANALKISHEEGFLTDFTRSIARDYPYIDDQKTLTASDLRTHVENILKAKNLEGQIVYLEQALKNNTKATHFKLYADLARWDNSKKLVEYFYNKYPEKTIEILDYKAEETVWSLTYDPPWEVEVFEQILRDQLYNELKAGDQVEIYGCLSEEKEVREALAGRIKDRIKKAGCALDNLNIYSAYKQGFSWITEKVILELKELGKIDQIVIKFKPFLQEGCQAWFDEDGAVPTSSKIMEDDQDRWFDLPIRFLQELYPVDDILAEALGMDRDQIVFEADENLSDTYQIICKKDGQILYEDQGTAKVSERPYLDEFPELGKVHPSTGWITVHVNGKKTVDMRIATDLENIWDFYQKTVLDKTKEFVLERGKGKILTQNQPFFKELRVEAEISDLDLKLPVRMDLISSLDAFHEDIYFVGADFFKFLGIKLSGTPALEPGMILPIIKKVNGRGPKVRATLVREAFDGPRIFVDHEEYTLEDFLPRDEISVDLEHLDFDGEIFELSFAADSKSCILLSDYADLVNQQILTDIASKSIVTINFYDQALGRKKSIPKAQQRPNKSLKPKEPLTLNTGELIGYEDYIGLMDQLKDLPGIKSYVAARSYQGRDVYVVEMFDDYLNDIVSRAKFINYKPVCLINSRHHANEISSTNAAFDLIMELTNNQDYKHYLDQLNIVIIPFENPDGGHIHYELQKDNPEWKLHVARFNALGKDITAEWFNFDTIHTEALAFTKTWFKWLPDIVTDNHGVPSHEWDQQFSGYVSPSFKGFWIPRALYYGYFWYITDEEYTKNNVAVARLIQDRLSDLINEDKEISRWNKDWADRFEKYAHRWMPKMFPADYYKNLIYYWIPFDTKKVQKYSSHRYPNITSLDWTTEVADETATGDYLKLCSRTHVKGCLAAMDSAIKLNNATTVQDCEKDGKIVLSKKRRRPLYID